MEWSSTPKGGFPIEIKTKIRYLILVLISIGNPPIEWEDKEKFYFAKSLTTAVSLLTLDFQDWIN